MVVKITQRLAAMTLANTNKWNLIEFEKDDPTNYHIEFVGSVANLRARNYKI